MKLERGRLRGVDAIHETGRNSRADLPGPHGMGMSDWITVRFSFPRIGQAAIPQ